MSWGDRNDTRLLGPAAHKRSALRGHNPPKSGDLDSRYAQPMRLLGGLFVLMFLAAGALGAQQGATPADLVKDPAIKAALDAVKANEAQTIDDQIRFCQIPAPS